jgi:protein-disulfide isomerase
MPTLPPDTLREPLSDQDWPLGPDDAPVAIVEYSDYDCPDCRAAYPIVETLLAQQAGRVRFAVRHFPLTNVHPRALAAARAAEAAGRQGKFWQMHQTLFAQPIGPSDEQLHDYARQIDLDMERFADDFADQQLEREILRRRGQGLRSGVNGAPIFYINSAKYTGEVTLEALTEAIDAAAQSDGES